MKIKIFIVLLILSGFLFNSCNDGPSPIGSDLVSTEDLVIKTFDTSVDTVSQYSKYFKKVIALGASAKILVGKYNDIEASGLMRFVFSLTDSLKGDINDNNINVLEAKMTLRRTYQYGDTSASMDFTVHKVNNLWSPFDFTIDSLPSLNYNTENVSSNIQFSDTTCVLNLSNDLVSDWMKLASGDTSVTNYGIYLKPEATSGKVLGFQAYTSTTTNEPILQVVIQKAGSYTDTISAIIVADNSLVNGNIPTIPSDDIVVQSGISVNAFLAFDFSPFPKGAVINSAKLYLTEDSVETKTGSSFSNTLTVYFVNDSTDYTVANGSNLALLFTDGKFSGNITSYVREWVFRNNNNGILIRPGNQFEGLEKFALKGSNASDINVRPRIKIVYSVKK